MLDGGKLIRYGAKAIPEGGLFAMPRAYADGLLIVGDSAGFLNGMRLKGIHLGNEIGHARGGDHLGSAAEPAFRQRRTCRRTNGASKNRGPTTSCARRAISIRAFMAGCGLDCSMRGSRRLPAAQDSACIERLPGEHGYAR